MMNTSRSRQLDCNCTSRQSFANRLTSTGRCGTARCAQISAVSAGCDVPPKTEISRIPVALFLRLERGQAEALPDLRLDVVRAGARVDREHVLLAPEDLQHPLGLLVPLLEPDLQGLLGVILPGDQLAPAHVAL